MRPREVVADFAGHARVAKHRGDVMGSRFGMPLIFAQHDQSVIQVLDDARGNAVQADEAQSAQNLFGREKPRELVLVSKAVLQGDDGGLRTHQRRQ